jgi:hypothetical protein
VDGTGRDAWIDVPLKVLPGTRVELVVAEVRDRQGCGTITVEVNGVPLDLERSANDGGFMLAGCTPVVYRSERWFTRVSIRTPEPVPRHGAPDPREVGLGITELRLCPPPIEKGPGENEKW